LTIAHPDYAQEELRFHYIQYNKIISETMTEMFEYVNPRNEQYAPLIAEDVK
jgi:ribonucleoside-diphosphate reductase alpha chain